MLNKDCEQMIAISVSEFKITESFFFTMNTKFIIISKYT